MSSRVPQIVYRDQSLTLFQKKQFPVGLIQEILRAAEGHGVSRFFVFSAREKDLQALDCQLMTKANKWSVGALVPPDWLFGQSDKTPIHKMTPLIGNRCNISIMQAENLEPAFHFTYPSLDAFDQAIEKASDVFVTIDDYASMHIGGKGPAFVAIVTAVCRFYEANPPQKLQEDQEHHMGDSAKIPPVDAAESTECEAGVDANMPMPTIDLPPLGDPVPIAAPRKSLKAWLTGLIYDDIDDGDDDLIDDLEAFSEEDPVGPVQEQPVQDEPGAELPSSSEPEQVASAESAPDVAAEPPLPTFEFPVAPEPVYVPVWGRARKKAEEEPAAPAEPSEQELPLDSAADPSVPMQDEFDDALPPPIKGKSFWQRLSGVFMEDVPVEDDGPDAPTAPPAFPVTLGDGERVDKGEASITRQPREQNLRIDSRQAPEDAERIQRRERRERLQQQIREASDEAQKNQMDPQQMQALLDTLAARPRAKDNNINVEAAMQEMLAPAQEEPVSAPEPVAPAPNVPDGRNQTSYVDLAPGESFSDYLKRLQENAKKE